MSDDIVSPANIELAQSVGPITNFHLVLDRETNRSRGKAFVEYVTLDAAQSAVHHFNQLTIGNRSIRAEFANDPSKGSAARSFRNTNSRGNYGFDNDQQGQYGNQRQVQQQPVNSAPPVQTSPPSTYLIAPDGISKTLSHIPPIQLLELITQIKILITQSPGQAQDVLISNPVVTNALVQALLLMGLIDANVVAQALQGQNQPIFDLASDTVPSPLPAQNDQRYEAEQPFVASLGPPPGPPGPPPGPAPSAQPDILANMDPTQAAAMRQILEMPDQQFNSIPLPPDQKAALYDLRQRYRQGGF